MLWAVRLLKAGAWSTLPLVLAGCALTPIDRHLEPTVIIIKNSTPQNINRVSLMAPVNKNGSIPMGEISPVPAGVSQTFIRPDNATPLPETLHAEWVMESGQKYSATLDIHKVLTSTKDKSRRLLVFDIYPRGHIKTYLRQTDSIKTH